MGARRAAEQPSGRATSRPADLLNWTLLWANFGDKKNGIELRRRRWPEMRPREHLVWGARMAPIAPVRWPPSLRLCAVINNNNKNNHHHSAGYCTREQPARLVVVVCRCDDHDDHQHYDDNSPK